MLLTSCSALLLLRPLCWLLLQSLPGSRRADNFKFGGLEFSVMSFGGPLLPYDCTLFSVPCQNILFGTFGCGSKQPLRCFCVTSLHLDVISKHCHSPLLRDWLSRLCDRVALASIYARNVSIYVLKMVGLY